MRRIDDYRFYSDLPRSIQNVYTVHDGSLQFISFLYLLMLTCVTHISLSFLKDRITFTYLNYYGLLTAIEKEEIVDLRKLNYILGVVKMIFFEKCFLYQYWLLGRLELAGTWEILLMAYPCIGHFLAFFIA